MSRTHTPRRKFANILIATSFVLQEQSLLFMLNFSSLRCWWPSMPSAVVKNIVLNRKPATCWIKVYILKMFVCIFMTKSNRFRNIISLYSLFPLWLYLKAAAALKLRGLILQVASQKFMTASALLGGERGSKCLYNVNPPIKIHQSGIGNERWVRRIYRPNGSTTCV